MRPVLEYPNALVTRRLHFGTSRASYTIYSHVLGTIESNIGGGLVPATALAAHRTNNSQSIILFPGTQDWHTDRRDPTDAASPCGPLNDVRRTCLLRRCRHELAIQRLRRNRQAEPGILRDIVTQLVFPALT